MSRIVMLLPGREGNDKISAREMAPITRSTNLVLIENDLCAIVLVSSKLSVYGNVTRLLTNS